MVKRKMSCFCVVALLTFSVSLRAVTKAQLDYLVSKLQSDDETKSSQAALKLAKYGPEAIAVLPDLLDILREPGIHLYTGQLVKYIIAEESTDKILELMNDDNSRVQSLAFEMIKDRKLETNKALNIYTGLLEHENPHGRLQAIGALCELGAKELCLDVVIELASHEDALVRAMAITKIGEYGISNDRIKGILLNSFKDPDKREAVKAALIYQQLYPEDKIGIDQLCVFMKDEDRNVRWQAVQAVGNLKKIGEQRMELAISLLDDKDPLVAIRACYTMIRHDIHVSRARELLSRSLKSEEFTEVIVGLHVLKELGPLAQDYEDRLLELTVAEDELVQLVAIFTLGEIDPSREKVIPVLNKTLRTTNDFLVWNMTRKTLDKLTNTH